MLRDQGHDVFESLGAASVRLGFILGTELSFYAGDILDMIRGETTGILLSFLIVTEQKREQDFNRVFSLRESSDNGRIDLRYIILT